MHACAGMLIEPGSTSIALSSRALSTAQGTPSAFRAPHTNLLIKITMRPAALEDFSFRVCSPKLAHQPGQTASTLARSASCTMRGTLA